MASLVLFLLLLAGPATAAADPNAPSRTIVGEIVWVDLPTRLVLIRESVKTTRVKGQPPARQTVAVSVSPEVPLMRGKNRVTLEELKPKDHVTARYAAQADGAHALTLRVAEPVPTRAPGDEAAAASSGN